MKAAKFDYYCKGNPLDREGNKVGSWKACSDLCFNEKLCAKWRYSGRDYKCFMYSECDFMKSSTHYRKWKYVAPSIKSTYYHYR